MVVANAVSCTSTLRHGALCISASCTHYLSVIGAIQDEALFPKGTLSIQFGIKKQGKKDLLDARKPECYTT